MCHDKYLATNVCAGTNLRGRMMHGDAMLVGAAPVGIAALLDRQNRILGLEGSVGAAIPAERKNRR